MINFANDSTVWAVVMTIVAYGVGTYIQGKTKKAWVNPLIIACLVMMLFLNLCRIPYDVYKEEAELLTYLLLPATVSLAIPLYEQWTLLKKNLLAIVCGISAGALTSVLCILLLAWLFQLEPQYAVSLMPKSVTTAIGTDVSVELGGIAALTAGVIILTGIVGNLLAQTLCKLFRITDPIAKGVAIGTSSHAIGTTKALEMGQVEGAMSSLAIAVAGIITAVLCPMLAQFLP